MATYVNDLRLKEIATGDESGTWGTSTNTNLELIGEAFSFGTEAITTNADTHTTTIADGSTDPGRSIYLKYTGTLDSACTITIGPNTVSKLWFIENGTSGSQNIIISQGSGANVTIPAGDVKAVYSDGAGSGAAIVDAFASLSVVDLKVQDDLTVTDDMTVGGTLGVTGVLTATSLDISGDIDVDGTTNLDVVDIDGAVDMASTLNVTGAITGTLGTAAQPNITSLGTITSFRSTGIDDNADALAITIDSSEKVGIGTTSPSSLLHIAGTSGTLARIVGTNASSDVRLLFDAGGTTGQIQYAGASHASLADTLTLVTQGDIRTVHAGSQKVTIKSDGKVGIGTSSPAQLLHIKGGASGSSYSADSADKLILEHSDSVTMDIRTPSNAQALIMFSDGTRSQGLIGYNHSDDSLRFSNSGNSERMRINSSGTLLVGKTASSTTTAGFQVSANDFMSYTNTSTDTGDRLLILNQQNRSSGNLLEFRTQGSNVGIISLNSSGNMVYGGTSDYRLKENLKPIENGLDRLNQLNPVSFDWKETGINSEGFIAHEVQEIFTDAVSGEKDGEHMQQLDYGRITPLLVKAIQEQQTQIDALQSEINTLKGE